MKTFRLIALRIYTEEEGEKQHHPISLKEGLIINKEDEHKNWLIEMMIDKNDCDLFKKINEKDEAVLIEVTISNRENPPAFLIGKVCLLKEFGEKAEVLMNASIVVHKDDFSELALKDLINQGYQGEELLEQFKKIKSERGQKYHSMIKKEFKEI